jgi:hypothetical protein
MLDGVIAVPAVDTDPPCPAVASISIMRAVPILSIWTLISRGIMVVPEGIVMA